MTLLRMAASYRHSADLIRLRIVALEDEAKTAPHQERAKLEQRVRELNVLYRETKSTARMLEHYYDRRYHADDRRAI